jgi:hypothetical protein
MRDVITVILATGAGYAVYTRLTYDDYLMVLGTCLVILTLRLVTLR